MPDPNVTFVAAARRPLDGITLVELSGPDTPLCTRLARALAGRMAADLGARVLVLEPVGGEPLRAMPPFLPASHGVEPERSALFQTVSAGKTLLQAAADPARRTEAARILASRADLVLVESGDPALAALDDHPSMVEIGCWPLTIEDPPARASEFTLLAMGGTLDMIGDPARQPLRQGGHQGAYPAGLAAFTALMAQLAAHEVGLRPDPARVSVLETLIWSNWKAICGAHADGRAPTRRGAESEFQVMRCRDGWIAFVYTVTKYADLCDLIGDPRLREPPLAERESRVRNLQAFFDILRPWFASRARDQIYVEAQARGIPFGSAYAVAELLEDPQYLASSFIATMAHPTLGTLRLPHLPVQWNGRRFAPAAACAAGGLDALTGRRLP